MSATIEHVIMADSNPDEMNEREKAFLEFNNKMLDERGKYWDNNVQENVKLNNRYKSARDLFDTRIGGNALVVGAGPSLYTNLENIRKAQKLNVSIIAVDRALDPLKKVGITPDIVITLDADHCVMEQTMLSIDDKDTLVFCMEQNIECVDHWTKMAKVSYVYHTIVANSWAHRKWFKDERLKNYFGLQAIMTVGTVGIDLAVRMGNSMVATIGQDYGWNKPNDVPEHYYVGTDEEGIIMVGLPDGRNMFTIGEFLETAQELYIYPKSYPHIKFMNMSDGIPMVGWEVGHFTIPDTVE